MFLKFLGICYSTGKNVEILLILIDIDLAELYFCLNFS